MNYMIMFSNNILLRDFTPVVERNTIRSLMLADTSSFHRRTLILSDYILKE